MIEIFLIGIIVAAFSFWAFIVKMDSRGYYFEDDEDYEDWIDDEIK